MVRWDEPNFEDLTGEITCPQCGGETPPGAVCAVCGAPLLPPQS
jgi:hypothetical protein